MGIPMLFVSLPWMLLGLIPVIVIEGFLLTWNLAIEQKVAFKVSIIGNLLSTLIGIPLTWALLFGLQIFTGGGTAYGLESLSAKILAVTWQAPWLVPYVRDLPWMMPAAGLTLLVFFFFTSYWIELQVARRVIRNHNPWWVRSAVREANLVTYGLFFALVLVLLVPRLLRHTGRM